MTTLAQEGMQDDYWSKEVFPHSGLRQFAQDLWVVQGEFPAAKLPRNMVVYRYAGRSLLLHSVVALEERAMRQLEALGTPSIMVIPHWDHWAHVAAYRRRYPGLTVVCPRASIARTSRHVDVDFSCEDYFPRHDITFHMPPGIEPVEGVLEVPLNDGAVALIMNDLITNVPHQPGIYGLLLKLTRSTGRPRVIFFVKRSLRVHRALVRSYIESLAQRRDIQVLTTSHGECLTSNIPLTLSSVARDL